MPIFTRSNAATALVAAVALMSFSACSSGPASVEGAKSSGQFPGVTSRTIGYVDQFAAGAMQMRWFNYFKAGTDALGWKVVAQDAKGDPTKGNQQAVALLNEGVDALAISCFDTAPMRAALKLAESKKIPVIQIGCPTPEPEAWTGVFAEDEAALSRNLSDYINKQNSSGGETALLFDTQLMAGRIRTETLKSELAKSDTKIVCERAIDLTNLVDSSRKAASACLGANPNLTSIISVYDYFAPPAIEAIKSAGKAKTVAVYGYYADAFNLPNLLAKGSPLKALTDGPVEQVALTAVDQLAAFFEKKTPLDSSATTKLDVPYTIYTVDNAPKFSKGYITPYPVATYLDPLLAKWKKEYGATK